MSIVARRKHTNLSSTIVHLRKGGSFLLFVYHESHLPLMKTILMKVKGIENVQVKVIALNYHLSFLLQSEDIPHHYIEDVVPREIYRGLYSEALSLAEGWYHFPSHFESGDPTEVEGYSMGSVVQSVMNKVFGDLIQSIRNVKYLLGKEDPKGVIVFQSRKRKKKILLEEDEDYHVRILESEAEKKEISCFSIPLPRSGELRESTKDFFKGYFGMQNISFVLGGKARQLQLPVFLLFLLKKVYFLYCGAATNLLLRREENAQKNGGAKRVLIASPSALNYIGLGIIDKIDAEGKGRSFVLNENGGMKRSRRFHSITPSPFFLLKYIMGWARNKKCFRGRYLQFLSQSQARKNFRCEGYEVEKILHDLFHYLFLQKFPFLLFRCQWLQGYISTIKPSIIVSHADTPEDEKVVVKVGKNLSIPTLVVEHGTIGHPAGFFPFESSKIAVWGKVAKEWFIEKGVSSEQLVVTGPPKFDDYFSCIKNREKEDISLNEKGFFLYATPGSKMKTYFPDIKPTFRDNVEILESLIALMREMPEKKLLMKLKGLDPYLEFYVRLIERSGAGNVSVVSAGNLKDLLERSEIVFTGFSTVGVEAMYFGRPLVQLDYTSLGAFDETIPFAKYGAAVVVRRPGNLIGVVTRLYQDRLFRESIQEGQRNFLHDYCFKLDGQATARVYSLIEHMAHSKYTGEQESEYLTTLQ